MNKIISKAKEFKGRKLKITAIAIIAILLIGAFGAFAIEGPNKKDADKQISNSQEVEKTAGEEKSPENEGGEETSSGSSSNNGSDSNSGTNSNNGSSGSSSSSSNEATTVAPESQTVTVYIGCKSIIDNKAQINNDSLMAITPSNGVIMSTTTVTIAAGDTVYDVTAKACAQRGVAIGGSSSYVTSFNGVSEKAAGGMSGWKFSYNGSFGGKAANQIKVSDGDSISWGYTIDGGSAY